jgi:hypothetical protein
MPASAPATRFVVPANLGAKVRTAVAIVNPGAAPAKITFSDSEAQHRGTLSIPPHGQFKGLLDEDPFSTHAMESLETVVFQSDVPVVLGCVVLSQKADGSLKAASVPAETATPTEKPNVYLPFLFQEQNVLARLTLVNSSELMMTGSQRWFDASGTLKSERSYNLPPLSARDYELPPSLDQGFVEVTNQTSKTAPNAVMLLFRNEDSGSSVVTSIWGQAARSENDLYSDTSNDTHTSVLISNPQHRAVRVKVETGQSAKEISIPPLGSINTDFGLLRTNHLRLHSDSAFAVMTIRTAAAGGSILSAIPPISWLPGNAWFPQLEIGGRFSTHVAVFKSHFNDAGSVNFFDRKGQPLRLSFSSF